MKDISYHCMGTPETKEIFKATLGDPEAALKDTHIIEHILHYRLQS